MSTQSNCPKCGESFPTSFRDSMDGTAEIIVHNGELSAIIEFDCPECGEELVLEDARGPSFGVNPR